MKTILHVLFVLVVVSIAGCGGGTPPPPKYNEPPAVNPGAPKEHAQQKPTTPPAGAKK